MKQEKVNEKVNEVFGRQGEFTFEQEEAHILNLYDAIANASGTTAPYVVVFERPDRKRTVTVDGEKLRIISKPISVCDDDFDSKVFAVRADGRFSHNVQEIYCKAGKPVVAVYAGQIGAYNRCVRMYEMPYADEKEFNGMIERNGD